MLNGLVDRLLSAPDSPTADLYFRNACGDFLNGHVAQIAPTVFASDTACLVMRHDMRSGGLPQRRRLIYFVDDDVDAGLSDASLPFLYRQKLRLVEHPAARRIARYAGVAVVGSGVLAEAFRSSVETHLLRPYWSEPLSDQRHFAPLMRGDGPIDIAFLGSSIHRGDLEFILPAVARALAIEPRVNFHLPERHVLPGAFEKHPRIHRIRGLGWSAYRTEISRRRFHLALYPLVDTPFNRARSPNKLIEHAVVGAAPLYSASWVESQRVPNGLAGLRLPNDPAVWVEAILALIKDPARMRNLAEGARSVAERLNRSEPQRALWRRLLGVTEPAIA
ncbi:MAG: hypothetical protein AAGK00_13960 [Pseudomonadota bacterium]